MAEDIKLSKAEIEELRSLLRLLREEMDQAQFENLLKSGPAAKRVLNDLRKEATEFTSDIGGTLESIKLLTNQLKGTKSGANQVLSAFKGIYDLGKEIQYAQRDITTLTEKDIAKLEEKMAMKALDLENANKILKADQASYEKAEKFHENQIDFYKKEKEKLDQKTTWNNKDLERYEELEKLNKKEDEHLEKVRSGLKKVKEYQEEISGILSKQDGHYNTLVATLAKAKRQLEEQNELLGLGGAAVGSLNTALGQLGFDRLAGALGINKASAEMDEFAKKIVKDREEQLALEKEISDEIDSRTGEKLSPEVLEEKKNQLDALKSQNAQYDGINGKLAILKKGVSSMGASLVKNLTDPLALATFFTTQLISALKSSDEATGQLAKQFGTSYKEASNMRQELNSVANSSFDVNVSTKNLQESLMAVNQALGTNGKLNEADLVTMTKLTKQAGYTHEELMGIEKLSLAQGKSLEDNVKLTLGSAKAHAAAKGLMINEKEVLKEVNKMSASLKLSLGGSVDKMAEAVVKTKALGLSIEQAEKMASGLLQFESSISDELEAEMLTGKSLNFERARLLALNNDAAGAAEEIVKQVEKAGDFTKMNRIQQEAVAKAAGMTRDELAQSIIDKKALAKLDVEGAKTAKEAYEELKKQGLSEQQIREKLGDDELAQQLESQSLQEKFNATVEKLKEIFVSLADPLLEIFNSFSIIFKVIGGIASGIGFVINKVVEFGNYLDDLTGGALSGVLGTVLKIGVGLGLIGLAAGKLGPIFSAMMTPVKALGKGIAALIPKDMGGILGKIKDKFSGGSKADDLAGKAKDTTKGGGASKLGNFMKGINATDMLKGAAAILVLAGALYVAAKAFQEFGEVTWEGVAKGTVALGGLTIAALALGKIKGKILEGALAIGVLGASLTPAAYALQMFSKISWGDLAKAGVALVGLGVAGAAFGALAESGLLFAGALAIAALGASLIPFAYALNLMVPALEKFTPIIEAFGGVIEKVFTGIAGVITSASDGLSNLFKTLGEVDPIKLFAIGPALMSIGAGLAVLGGGSLAGGILGSIGKLFGGGVVEKLNELSSIDSSKIMTLAEAIAKLSESITNLNSVTANVGDVSPIITTVDKVVELHDSLNKTSLEKVVDKVSEGVSSLFSKAFEFVSSVSSTDKTLSSTESATSASSLSSAASSSKSLVDKTNIEAKEVILNVSDKAVTNLITDKSKEINTKLSSSDKVKDLEKTKKTVGEFDTNKLKEELLTNEKTNELLAASVDNLKVTNLIVEKQTTEKTKESNSITKGVTGGAITGAAIGGLIGGPLGMLAGGLIGGAASSLFGSNEEEITPINNETQIQSQTITSPNNNATASTLTTNNQNITSSDNVVKILQEAVTVLKAIQAKDTSVQLALDGDVIARKIAPGVNKEQVKAYSNL